MNDHAIFDYTSAAFSRRDLINGGALIIGFALAGVPTVAAAATGAAAGPPDPSRIDSWIAVHPDNTATVFLGKCELARVTPPACCRSPAKSSIST